MVQKNERTKKTYDEDESMVTIAKKTEANLKYIERVTLAVW